MRDSAEGAQLLGDAQHATRRATSHAFVIGSSGMGARPCSTIRTHSKVTISIGAGKTSTIFALAREAGAYPGKYLIYLQCPRENRTVASGTGCTMADGWIGPTPGTKEGVKQLFYRARVAVLYAVVEAGGSPMDWLAYTLSDSCGKHIRRVLGRLPPGL
jgi:hypothetical protein